MTDQKMCERCSLIRACRDIKYCPKCKSAVLAELRKAGYLESDYVPKQRTEHRDRSQRPSNAIGCDYHAEARDEDI